MVEHFSGPVQNNQHELPTTFKFQEFHTCMNEILAKLPYIEAARLTLECMERANAALEQFSSTQRNE